MIVDTSHYSGSPAGSSIPKAASGGSGGTPRGGSAVAVPSSSAGSGSSASIGGPATAAPAIMVGQEAVHGEEVQVVQQDLQLLHAGQVQGVSALVSELVIIVN